MKIKIPYTPCGLSEFYDRVATEMGHGDPSEFKYDCRKINVAENIQDGFFEYYKAMKPDVDAAVEIGMMLVCSGPKVDKNLKANEVEIFEGFIC